MAGVPLIRFIFLSTLSLRRATIVTIAVPRIERNFYPRSPCGERPYKSIHYLQVSCISIHALLAESDQPGRSARQWHDYFYPRSPCGERRGRRASQHHRNRISIHALLAESDCTLACPIQVNRHFYPRSPCGERQLRPICWGKPTNFYPRSPCGERRCNPPLRLR